MAKLIFILEDDDDLRALYSYILEDEDYNIRAFATVTEFMENASEVPDLYLLDVMLPDGDGIQLCKEIKKNPITEKVPIILVSAHKDLADVQKECPGTDFLAKPFDIEKLVQHIASKINAS